MTMNQVATAKVKYKEDSERGELIICLQRGVQTLRAEADGQFSAVDVKSILLNAQLSPLEFRRLND